MVDNSNTNGHTLSARDLRRMRKRRLALRFLIVVGVPTILSIIYYGIVASDIYQSEAVITVQSQQNRPALGLEAILGGVVGAGSAKDSLTVREYILSREMLQFVEQELRFTEHYSNQQADYLARLPRDATFEEKFEYYQEWVQANFDTVSGILKVSVQAFSAERAKTINDAILKRSEEKVNALSNRAKADQIAFAKREVAEAEQRIADVQQRLLTLQNQGAEFHPGNKATTVMTVQGHLEIEIANARAALNQASKNMKPSAPKVVALRQRVQALELQLKRENKRLVDPENSALNTSIAKFESAMMEKSFAEKQYESSMASLELAKMEADKKSRYLATIASPSLPDEALYPQRVLGVLTVFLVSLAIFGIGSLLVAAVKEHARL